jgi:hypothetical protein
MLTYSESERFDATVSKVLSVSHEEFKKRDKEWKKKRAARKRAKTSP